MPVLVWLPCGHTAAGAMRIFMRVLMHVLEPDLEAGDCPGNGLYYYCLIGVHTTNRVIACSLIYNRNLACGVGTSLDYCDVISVAGELGMVIITHWVGFTSCCLVGSLLPMSHPCRPGDHDSEATCGLIGSHLHQEWELFGSGSLVSFWCEDTYHVASPDRRSSQDRTCPWDLACSLPLTFVLVELVAG
jgi:hypothetical protein